MEGTQRGHGQVRSLRCSDRVEKLRSPASLGRLHSANQTRKRHVINQFSVKISTRLPALSWLPVETKRVMLLLHRIPLSAGLFNRTVYLEGMKRRVQAWDPQRQWSNSSNSCTLQWKSKQIITLSIHKLELTRNESLPRDSFVFVDIPLLYFNCANKRINIHKNHLFLRDSVVNFYKPIQKKHF